MGKLAEAEKTYRTAIQVWPQYWAGYGWLGSFYSRQARYAEAERETRQAIALAPDNPHAYRMLGGIYIFNGEYDKAIEVLQHAIALYPAREAYSNLGVAYFNLRRFGDAVKALQNVCTDVTKSLDFDSCGNLARAYYWSPDDRAKARETYQRAVHMAEENLKINPKNGDTHILMANYYAMLGDSSSAFKSLERALKLGPGTPEYLAIAAVVHNHFGRKNDALNYLEKARFRGYSVAEIKASPEFDNLRDNARFRQVVSAR
jgi:tetratricopeptide (TPR) repeat protein